MKALELFPAGTQVGDDGEILLGGCYASALAREFGTPLYVFDEGTLRSRGRVYREALSKHYPGEGRIAYAAKAGLNLALVQLFDQMGLNLDIVSAGELYLAQQAGFPPDRTHFHGSNKTTAELRMALDANIGRVVVDNLDELDLLERTAAEKGICAPIWLRLSPDVDARTHSYRKTGILDSKFGFPLATGDAQRAVAGAMASPYVDLVGMHAHIGSQIYEVEPFVVTVHQLVDFAAEMRAQYDFELRELSPGGGWGVPQQVTHPPAPVEQYVEAVCRAVMEACDNHRLALPTLVLEPGRSLVAPAGVALYRVGARKEIPGVRTYVSVDGGMADNLRPALYGARYTAVVANKANRPVEETVTIVGRYCESGDVLLRDIALPRLVAGDLLAVPMVGAYCLAMASNYNMTCRPAVVMVREGQARQVS
jgi:diaminopimelate decarboxylase